LLGTNWAAFDLVRYIAEVRSLERNSGGSSEMIGKEMCQIGAAFTVLWWGTLHALAQLCIVFTARNDTAKGLLQRKATLAIGLAFPLIALSVALFTLVDYKIPALYWSGITKYDHSVFLWTAYAAGL
jgi:hypothetical protein